MLRRHGDGAVQGPVPSLVGGPIVRGLQALDEALKSEGLSIVVKIEI
jgi:hypothetical protein